MPNALTREEIGRRFMAADDSYLLGMEAEFLEACRVRQRLIEDAKNAGDRPPYLAEIDQHIRYRHWRTLAPRGVGANPHGIVGCAVVLSALLDTELGIAKRLSRLEGQCLEHILYRLRGACPVERPLLTGLRDVGNHSYWWEHERRAKAGRKRDANVVFLRPEGVALARWELKLSNGGTDYGEDDPPPAG